MDIVIKDRPMSQTSMFDLIFFQKTVLGISLQNIIRNQKFEYFVRL